MRHGPHHAAQKSTSSGTALAAALEDLIRTTTALGLKGMTGDADGMLRHAADYMDAFSVTAIAWQLLAHAVAAAGSARRTPMFCEGVQRACDYWFHAELPHAAITLARVRSAEASFAEAPVDCF